MPEKVDPKRWNFQPLALPVFFMTFIFYFLMISSVCNGTYVACFMILVYCFILLLFFLFVLIIIFCSNLYSFYQVLS